MRCLSVLQPWAWAIIHGPKCVENRSWPTKYRGPLLIHAGKSRSLLDGTAPSDWIDRGGLKLPSFTAIGPKMLAFGALIGQVELVECIELAKADELPAKQRDWLKGHPFTEGPFCWIVKNPQAFPEPIAYRGQQSLFHVPTDALRAAAAGNRGDAGTALPVLV